MQTYFPIKIALIVALVTDFVRISVGRYRCQNIDIFVTGVTTTGITTWSFSIGFVTILHVTCHVHHTATSCACDRR